MVDATSIVRDVFRSQLLMGERADSLADGSAILGAIPEFDSLAVVNVITALEEQLGIVIDDDEITPDIFVTVGSLARFIESKLS